MLYMWVLISHNYVIKVKKQVEGKIKNFQFDYRDHTIKCGETREITYTCRYTTRHLIPNYRVKCLVSLLFVANQTENSFCLYYT